MLKCFAIAVQGLSPRIEIYTCQNHSSSSPINSDIDVAQFELKEIIDDCVDVGYSHLDISHDGKFLIAISKMPDLQIEYWTFDAVSNERTPEKVATSVVGNDIKICEFSPINNKLFVTATDHHLVLWRVYYKFDQYFLTSITHEIKHSDRNPRKLTSLAWVLADTNSASSNTIPSIETKFDDKTVAQTPRQQTQIIYSTNMGELIWLDEENPSSMNIVHIVESVRPIFKLFYTKTHYILVFADDGECNWLNKTKFTLQHKYNHGTSLRTCCVIPSFTGFIVLDETNDLWKWNFSMTLLSAESASNQNLITKQKVCTCWVTK